METRGAKYTAREMKLMTYLMPTERTALGNMRKKQRTHIFDSLAHIPRQPDNNLDIPLRMQVLQKEMNPDLKLKLFNDIVCNDNPKFSNYIHNVLQLPFGIRRKPTAELCALGMEDFLVHAREVMDANITGNDPAKNEILKLLCGWRISGNLASHAIAFEGRPGVGKTHFVKTAFAQAMGLPVVFVSLGGCTDSNYLMGTIYTYEGSTYGRLASALIESQCENPIIFFDELDKISTTPKGADIVNTLIHIIDPVQNKHVRDNYFGFDMDFSNCTFVFSYNDESAVNPILLDRMKRIQFETPSAEQRIRIIDHHILPRLQTKLHSNLEITREAMEYIVQRDQTRGKNTNHSPHIRGIVGADHNIGGMRGIEKDVEHMLLIAEIVRGCKASGGHVVGLDDVHITSNVLDENVVSKILPIPSKSTSASDAPPLHMYL